MLLSLSGGSERASNPLAGLRVLLVEDDFLIAQRLKRLLEELGCEVVGPAPTVDEGLRLATHAPVDAGLLDINVRDGTSAPVAHALRARGAPFLFVSGYSSPHYLPDELKRTRRLSKPVLEDALREALIREISG